jgi:hypothetical protein
MALHMYDGYIACTESKGREVTDCQVVPFIFSPVPKVALLTKKDSIAHYLFLELGVNTETALKFANYSSSAEPAT